MKGPKVSFVALVKSDYMLEPICFKQVAISREGRLERPPQRPYVGNRLRRLRDGPSSIAIWRNLEQIKVITY